MKQSIALLFCVLFCVNAYAQQPHNLQLDDGLGHYSLLEGSTTGGIYILPPGGGTLLTAPQPGTASLAWLTHGNLLLDSDWTNNILGNLDNNSLRIVTNAQTRFLIAADGSTSINDSAYAQTSIGNGSSNPQLVIRGNADALSGDGYPGPEWDLDVQGDAAIAGIARFGLTGNSIWIDGSGFVNTIQSDHDLTVESASALTLNSGGESPLYINDANGWNTYINSTVGATTTIGVSDNGSTIDLEAPTIEAPNVPATASASNVLILNSGNIEQSTLSFVTGTGTVNTIPKWTPSTNTLGDSKLTDNGTTLSYNSGSFTANSSAITMTSDDAGASVGDAGQIVVRGSTNNNQQLMLGYNTTGDYATIMSILQGTGGRGIYINPAGGAVGVDYAGGTALSANFNVNGTVNISSLPASASSTVVTTNGGTLESRPISEIAVTGTGTQNFITKWNNAGGTTIGNSLLSDDGTTVTSGATIIPGTTNTFDLGSSTNRWKAVFLAGALNHSLNGDNPLDNSGVSGHGLASHALNYQVSSDGYVATFSNTSAVTSDGVQIAVNTSDGSSRALTITNGSNFNPTGGVGNRNEAFYVKDNGTTFIGTLPASASSTVVTSNGGTLESRSIGEIAVTGTGTQDFITKWNNAGGTTIGNSLLSDNGTTLDYNTGKFTVASATGNTSTAGSMTVGNLTANGVVHATGGTGLLASSLIVNADVDPAAAIAYSKLNLASSIVNGDLAGGVYGAITGLGAQTQALNMGTHQINGVVDPTLSTDAATKGYVDTKVNGAVSGTMNTIAKFTSANVVGNSLLTDNGTTLAYNTSAFTMSSAGQGGQTYTIGGNAGPYVAHTITATNNNGGSIGNTDITGLRVTSNEGAGGDDIALGASFVADGGLTGLATAASFTAQNGVTNTAIDVTSGFVHITPLTASSVVRTDGSSNLTTGLIVNGDLTNTTYSNIAGIGSQSQALNMNTHQINGVVDPTSAQDAATKNYVDTKVNGAVSGTINTMAKFTSANAVGNSLLSDNGTTLDYNTGKFTVASATGNTSTGGSMTVGNLTTNGVVHATGGTGLLATSLIVNADVDPAAAIAYSKLNLTGGIVNADVSGTAAIAYSKLNLASSIVNGDLAGGVYGAITGLGAQTQALDMNSHVINNVADPVAGSDAATKNFVTTAGNIGVLANAPITGDGTSANHLAIAASTTSTDGYLTSTDWNTFNGKLSAVTSDAPLSGSGTSGSHLVIAQATTSTDGYLTSTDWNTFNGKLSAVTSDAPLSGSGTSGSHLVIAQATTSTDGYLTSTDWNTFNGKLSAVTSDAPLSGSGTSGSHLVIAQATTSTDGYLTSTDWNTFNGKLSAVTSDAPLSGSGTSGSHLVIAQATTSTDGYLTSTDWNTFNSKASALSGLTANGAVYATSTSAITSTAAMTNGQLLIGSTGVAPVLGTITGTASRLAVTNGAGTITLDIDANYAGQNTITTLGTIGTGTWNGTAIGSQYGGTGLNTSATLMGAMLYTSATGTWNTLSGPTAGSTKYFLTSTPSAGTAQPPSWVLLAASDIPDLSSTYIKNQTSLQASSNFNISGNGTIGSSLIVPTVTGGDGGVPVAITVHGGDGASTAGASTTLRGGDATGSFTGGAVSIRGGQSSTSGAGGAITISGGSSGPTGGAAGTLTLAGGSATGALTGGAAMLRGGTGGVTSGTGGQLTLAGGASGSAAGTGGNVVIQTASTGTGTTLTDRLTVDASGNAIVNTAGATLSVGEASGFGSNVSVNMKDGHLRSRITTAPTAVVTTGGGTVALANATDVAGYVTYTEGATPAAGDKVTVTFNKAYNAAPIVVISANDANAATSQAYVTSTATTFTVTLNAPIASVAHGFSYHVIETQ